MKKIAVIFGIFLLFSSLNADCKLDTSTQTDSQEVYLEALALYKNYTFYELCSWKINRLHLS